MKTFVLTAIATCMLACGATDNADIFNDQGQRTALQSEQAEGQSKTLSPSAMSSHDDADASPVEDAATEQSSLSSDGCSIVQYCNAPGSDGTRCIQKGCSVSAAKSECINEGWKVCGTPLCPWIFVTSSGSRIDLCH